MNPEKICYGCFREKGPGVCPYCGYGDTEEQPFLALPLGTILNGRYMTGKVLGVGGFGITYLGYDLSLEIKVAIKEYMPSGMATRYKDGYTVALTGRVEKEYAAGMERFVDEARILAKLQHLPNIVSVQNYFKENNTAYFVMEYIEGMSLKEYLAAHGGMIPYTEALAILLPVMEALCEVHSMNLMHRDISPDNIYITASGESRLLDFGAARFSMGDNKSVSVILKHGYAPEEQYSSHGNQGPWTDIYAMGATLYRCITGAVPPDSIERIHNDTIRKPSEMGVSLPATIETAVMKALSVKAEDRYSNMRAFIDALTGKKTAPTAERAGNMTRRTEEPVPASGKSGGFLEMLKTNPLIRWLIVGAAAAVVVFAVIFPAAGIYGGKDIPAATEGSDPPAATNGFTPSAAGTPSPPETDIPGEGMKTYDISGYGAALTVPSDWEEAADTWTFTSPDKAMSVSVELFYYQEYMACYSVDDIESNVEHIAAAAAKNIAGEGAAYEVRTAGAQQLSGAPAYQIDLRLTDANNAQIDTVVLSTATQNGFGMYMITGICPANDEQAYSTLRGYMDTFRVTAPADTTLALYENSELGIKFMYDTELTPAPEVTSDTSGGAQWHSVIMNPIAEDTTQGVEVNDVTPLGLGSSAKEVSDAVHAAAVQQGTQISGPYQEVWGGVEWTILEQKSEGRTMHMGFADIGGKVMNVMMLAEEANLTLMQDVMYCTLSSLRLI